MTHDTVVTASPAPSVVAPVCDTPDVSFVTVTFGTGAIAVDSIASLVDSLAAGRHSYEVIVVDNPHPLHATFTDLALFTAGVRVVRPDRNLGFGGGCELGAMYARGGLLGFVNPDMSFPSGWLDPLITALGDDWAPSIVAPVLRDGDGSIQEVGQMLDANGHTSPITTLPAGDQLMLVDYASAACWLMTRDEHERLGGFDPAYHPAYFEDVDLALRARRANGSCAVHAGVSVVHHRGHGTPDAPAPASEQHRILLDKWPEIAWTQPAASA
ncbi:MAG: glycosyltransferase family 2 protein [Ilumatobacter sp.]|uniref:glycosyltransferase n=1 Tax=Ilumatobacter sp. TaxID=1967498 RepID=UPI0026161F59|nr:glycosyltransferase family 2 protein [Ilumatobacter sp.]MDJ0768334.1 glycosyltransferase family 2 protein [Ilumatobacter sp.]